MLGLIAVYLRNSTLSNPHFRIGVYGKSVQIDSGLPFGLLISCMTFLLVKIVTCHKEGIMMLYPWRSISLYFESPEKTYQEHINCIILCMSCNHLTNLLKNFICFSGLCNLLPYVMAHWMSFFYAIHMNVWISILVDSHYLICDVCFVWLKLKSKPYCRIARVVIFYVEY